MVNSMEFFVGLSNQMLGLIFTGSCLYLFGNFVLMGLESLPRLRGAIIITINSMIVKMFSKYRVYDLLGTIPETTGATLGALSALSLALYQASVPTECQAFLSLCTLIYIAYRHFFLEIQKNVMFGQIK